MGKFSGLKSNVGIEKSELEDIKEMFSMVEVSSKDIAIIGMQGRFAEANNIHEFWNILKEGRDCIRELPEQRKNDVRELLKCSGKYDKEAEFLHCAFMEDIDKFDCSFFDISPHEASTMDPNQRLFLETAWRAVDDSGYGGKLLEGTKTGVFVGYSSDFGREYKQLVELSENPDEAQPVSSFLKSIIASRISYKMDLKGPSMMVDTACSSSLVAIHLACRSIRQGECDMAIAGSVNLSLTPIDIGERIGIESSNSRSRTFDDSSDGIGIGEGTAAVILKQLSKAISDNDNIYAVIKGSSFNQDGASIGLTAPNSAAQEEVILRAWRDAGIDPLTVSYIEAHGTGTKLGDPIEIEGINGAFGKYTDRKQFCAISSVKTNIGHLDNAAGIVGLIKAVLAMKNRQIPASLHFKDPNRKINFEESPVYVNDRLRNWETEGFPRRCGISSFGMSGTNCHIVLEEAPERPDVKKSAAEREIHVLTLSAKNNSVLKEMIKEYLSYLKDSNEKDMEDICHTANTGRGHYNFRLAIVFTGQKDLINKLKSVQNLSEMRNNSLKDVYFGEYRIMSELHLSGKEGELTEKARSAMNLDAAAKLSEAESVNDYEGLLRDICSLYVKGADVDWRRLYSGAGRRRVSLPAYPFERRRCWIKFKIPEKIEESKYEKNIGHPLVDYLLSDSINQKVFVTEFSIEKHWVLNEHKIMGNCVVPGTSYLEMAREVCSIVFGQKSLTLCNVYFITPLVVNEGEKKEVQTILRQEDGKIDFIIASKSMDGNWIKHSEGKVEIGDKAAETKKIDLEAILKNCPNLAEINSQNFTRGMMEFGPRWTNIKNVHIGENEVLGSFELTEEFVKSDEVYFLHPATMDCAINMANGSIGEGLYLPLAYKILKIYGPTPVKFFSYLKRKNFDQENPDSATFDIMLANEEGIVFAETEDYTVKKVSDVGNRFRELAGKSGMYYETTWIKEEPSAGSIDVSGEKILIFADDGGIYRKLSEDLRSKGAEVIEVVSGDSYTSEDNKASFTLRTNEEDYKRLIGELDFEGIKRIIHMATLGTDDESKGVFSLFYLVKSLSFNKIRNKIELMLVSDYADEVSRDEKKISPCNAAFLSLGRVIGEEMPNISCSCLDVDESVNASILSNEITASSKPFISAYRNGERYISEFRELNVGEKADIECPFRSDGVYLITGGTGGIGLEIGKYLSDKGRLNICLVNRSPFPNRNEWDGILDTNEDNRLCRKIEAIKAMESNGAHVMCMSANVSSHNEMEKLISLLRGKFGRINGVIHAAGIAGDSIMANEDESKFRSVIEPKMRGTRIIDTLTQADEPDFIVLFSSISSFLGGAGQGSYTAANAYMDAYAYLRNKKGRRTLTINWAAWKETGMAVDYGVNVDGIFKAITNEAAIRSFEEVLKKETIRVIIAEPNYLSDVFEGDSGLPFKLSEGMSLASRRTRAKLRNSSKSSKPVGNITLKGRDDGHYSPLEKQIAEIWGTLLGIDEIDIRDDFFVLGGNSLLALRLETEMEKNSLKIEYSDINTYPTVIELALYIENSLKGGLPSTKADGNKAEKNVASNSWEYLTITEEPKKYDVAVKQEDSLTIQNVEPFNDIIYRGCFYSAFFPVLKYFGRPILPVLANEVGMYEQILEENFKRLDIKYVLNEPIETVVENLGLIMDTGYENGDIIEYIKASLLNNQLVIVCVDCFYESIRSDNFNKVHMPHCLLVFGFNDSKKTFDILEHKHYESLVYEKRTISYFDMSNCYRGFIENFKSMNILMSRYGDLRIGEGKQYPSYFRFGLKEIGEDFICKDIKKTFANNILNSKDMLLGSLVYLKEFTDDFEAMAMDEQAVKSYSVSLLQILNTVINAKQAEKYKNNLLPICSADIDDQLKQITEAWNAIRAATARTMYSGVYKRDVMMSSLAKLKESFSMEKKYYERLFETLSMEL